MSTFEHLFGLPSVASSCLCVTCTGAISCPVAGLNGPDGTTLRAAANRPLAAKLWPATAYPTGASIPATGATRPVSHHSATPSYKGEVDTLASGGQSAEVGSYAKVALDSKNLGFLLRSENLEKTWKITLNRLERA